jgi:hypothetical protein
MARGRRVVCRSSAAGCSTKRGRTQAATENSAGTTVKSAETKNRTQRGRRFVSRRINDNHKRRIARSGDYLVDQDFDNDDDVTPAVDPYPSIADSASLPSNLSSTPSAHPSTAVSTSLPSEENILFRGLQKVNFSAKRQQRVKQKTNLSRFRAHYGPPPIVVLNILKDLKMEHPSVKLEYLLLTLNWFKLYDTEKVLSGRWDYCEDHIRCKIKWYGSKLQALKEKKIVFGNFNEDEIHWITVDTVNFGAEEFRGDPSTKYYNHKNNGVGFKYEFACALRRPDLVHIRGPLPCGQMHDSTMFRGGTAKTKKDDLDKSALYFKLPMGKKAIGDSGYEGMPEKVTVTRSGQSKELKEFLGRAKNRQESLHTKLKSYRILSHNFRHGKKGTQDKIDLHQMCVEAVCVIVQYDSK